MNTAAPSTTPAERQHPLDLAEERGRTTIAERAIEAMAARIISDEPGVGGVGRRVLGVAVAGADGDRAPRVEATVAGEVASLRVRLSVTYPEPVHTVTDRLRRRLIDRVGELTGKQIGMVEIIVDALHRPDTGRVVR
ncbi:MAG: Asp23/Gls24 family envelope stress response protein [Pseudonocardiaceae bacterium]